MYIYNVTTKVAHLIHTNWLHWMKNEHIPAVMSTNCFTKHVFVKLLELDEEDGVTYAVQYFAKNLADYNKYIDEFSSNLRNDGTRKWGNQTIAYRTLMQVVD